MAFFGLALLPVLQFVPVGFNMMADRYTYLAYVGLFWLLGLGYHHIYTKLNLSYPIILGAILAILLSVLSHHRIKVWQNSETLWADVIRKYPKNFIAYVNASDYCRVHGQLDKAVAYASMGLDRSGPHNYLYNNKAYALIMGGKYRQALEVLDQALVQLEPDPQIFVNRGDAYSGLNQYGQAVEAYTRSLAINSEYLSAQYRRGRMYLYRIHKFDQAIKDFEHVLALEPQNVELLTDLALAYYRTGNEQKSFEFFEKAERIDPGNTYLNQIKAEIQ